MGHKTRGTRTKYPSDVSDEEWAFCAPYLTLMREDAPQRDYSMRAIFNASRIEKLKALPRVKEGRLLNDLDDQRVWMDW